MVYPGKKEKTNFREKENSEEESKVENGKWGGKSPKK